MSKLIKKLPILFASFAMAMGVGLVGEAKEVKAEELLASFTANNKTAANGVTTLTTDTGESITFNIDYTGNNYWGWDSTGRGAQWGSGSSANTVILESTNYNFNAKNLSVTVNASRSSKGTIKSSVFVGDTQIGDTQTLTNTAADYQFVSTASSGSGNLKIELVNTGGPIYLKSFAIYGDKAVDRTVTKVTGVESYPEEVFEGDTINGEDVELNVLYDDGEAGVESADHVDVDTSSLGTTTATAYYDKEKTMFATFEVTVIEKPDALIFESNDVVNGTAYGEHSNDDWLLTIGGYNMACGSNGKKGDYTADKYADGKLVTSSTLAFVIATRNALSNVGKMTFTYGSGNGYSIGKMYLTYSTDKENYALVELTNTSVSTQGMSVGEPDTDYVFEFDPIESAAYYAIIVAGPTNATTTFRFDYVVAALYSFKVANPVDDVIALIDAIGEITYENYEEKEEALLEAWLAYEDLSPEEQALVTNSDVLFAALDKQENYEKVDKFIADWHTMRAEGSNGICDFDLNGENALTKLLNSFEEFDGEYKELIINAIDVDDITIGQTMDYINNVLKAEAAASEDSNLNSFVISTSDNTTTSLVALFAILGLVAVSAYYFIEKKRFAK